MRFAETATACVPGSRPVTSTVSVEARRREPVELRDRPGDRHEDTVGGQLVAPIGPLADEDEPGLEGPGRRDRAEPDGHLDGARAEAPGRHPGSDEPDVLH